jgi:hypothetical protein
MLELIGLIALVYLAIKFLPGILLFALKVLVVLVGIWLTLAVISWLFSLTPFVIIL